MATKRKYCGSSSFGTTTSVATGAIIRPEELRELESAITGIATPWSDINEITGGLQAGNLIIVGARPGIGKSIFGMNIAEHCAVSLGIPAMYVSLEMTGTQITNRILSSISGVPAIHISGPKKLNHDEFESLGFAISKIAEAPLYIGTQMGTVAQIRQDAEEFNRRNDKTLGIIVVDYLQLMSPSEKSDRADRGIGEITKSLKLMARDLNVAIVLLSQLSRKVDERTDKRPINSDLRDSGSIEQDADVIMMLFRDEYYRSETPDKGIAEVIITEHRNGPVGTVRLAYMPEKMRFENLAADS